jgi:hypothetical protein
MSAKWVIQHGDRWTNVETSIFFEMFKFHKLENEKKWEIWSLRREVEFVGVLAYVIKVMHECKHLFSTIFKYDLTL